jgi:hypothetical protein
MSPTPRSPPRSQADSSSRGVVPSLAYSSPPIRTPLADAAPPVDSRPISTWTGGSTASGDSARSRRATVSSAARTPRAVSSASVGARIAA